MRPNSVFSLAVVGSLLHSLTVFVLFFLFFRLQTKIYLKLSKKKQQQQKSKSKNALGLVSRKVCVNGI